MQITLNHDLMQSAHFHLADSHKRAAAGACFTNFHCCRILLVFIKFPCTCHLGPCTTAQLLPLVHYSTHLPCPFPVFMQSSLFLLYPEDGSSRLLQNAKSCMPLYKMSSENTWIFISTTVET